KPSQPERKRLLADIASAVLRTVFRQRREGSRRLAQIPGVGQFPFPKDTGVLAKWFSTVAGPDARILDPFLGSGTTVEVAMALNAADGGTRHVTGIALDEGGIVADVLAPRLDHCQQIYGDQVVVSREDQAAPTVAA